FVGAVLTCPDLISFVLKNTVNEVVKSFGEWTAKKRSAAVKKYRKNNTTEDTILSFPRMSC
ncbi:MAG: hypothetical protein LUC06_07430, partial [Oscillospiraceae bacterium]|nr:hypothetical protein [Oscillospiraceae bacterium]